MSRTQRVALVLLMILVGALPVGAYALEHGGLGTPAFADEQPMSRGLQAAQVIAGLYIKPLYMLASLAVIVWLRMKFAQDTTPLIWGAGAFLVGEIFCAVNFIVYRHASLVSEYIHSYGMVVAFGFVTYALLKMIDTRVLHVNHGRCALRELCQTCKRTTPLHCAMRRISLLALTLASLLVFLPLTAASTPTSYATSLFGFSYSYARFDLYQWYETRALPVLALLCFSAALPPLLRAKNAPIPKWTTVFFSAGFGMLGFSLFRLILASVFADELVWFEFWEEATELMFIAALAFLLWQFRESLDTKKVT